MSTLSTPPENRAQLPAPESARRRVLSRPGLFQSFWIAGFESACHINRHGQRLDMMAFVRHDANAEADYALLRAAGIRTARDGVRWNLIDRGGRYDFSALAPLVKAACNTETQVIWNLCHYGWPDDLDLFSAAFVDRFARYSAATARYIADHIDGVHYYAPVNEISFFSWAASRDLIYPFAHGKDDEIKKHLVRATIAACDSIWNIDPQARFVHCDPIIHVVPPRGHPELAGAAAAQHESQFSAWDMMAGRISPELGGDSRYLDIIGTNFYHANEWEYPGNRLRWEDEPRDERWVALHRLLAAVYERYRRPLFIAETSHFGVGRARWIREIAREVYRARVEGVPVEGICLFPILDRPDWEDLNHWHNSGLWDLVPNGSGEFRRVLNEDYAAALESCRALLAQIGCL